MAARRLQLQLVPRLWDETPLRKYWLSEGPAARCGDVRAEGAGEYRWIDQYGQSRMHHSMFSSIAAFVRKGGTTTDDKETNLDLSIVAT